MEFKISILRIIISEQSAEALSVAHGKIYYNSITDLGRVYSYLDENEEWHELKLEDFVPLYGM